MNTSVAPANESKVDGNHRQYSFGKFALVAGAILIGHYIVDTYSALMAPLLGVVEKSFSMEPQQAALLLGVGSIFSGLAQPTFAWFSDRLNTRWFGAIGILLAAVGIPMIGYASDSNYLFLIFAFGMIGVGMFHPIAASTIGHMAGDKRGLALSWFFVFGMLGFVTGSLIGPALATGDHGLKGLWILLIPGIIIAVFLQFAIGDVQHKSESKSFHKPLSLGDYDWRTLTFLYFSAVFRFVVNMAFVYLLVRWMEQYVGTQNPSWSAKKVADASAPLAGNANAVMIVGQLVGGLAAGAFVKGGNEKVALVWVPILLCPAFVALAYLQPGTWGYVACFVGGAGFGSMTPVAMSLGQRLMPQHTSLASGLMLGGGWVIASFGPRLAEYSIASYGLATTFMLTAATLALSGICAVGLNRESVRFGFQVK